MRDRVWFITGVARGMGHAIASAVLEAGETVIGTTRGGDASLSGHDGRFHELKLDLTDGEAIDAAVAQAFAIHGRLDVVVNNAAFPLFGALEEASDEQVRRIFDVNVHGPRRVIQRVLPQLRRQGTGYIVNITSVGAYVPLTGYGYYAATKAAMESLTEVLAEEAEPFGIRVTALIPGAFRTEFLTARSVEETAAMISGYDRTRANIQRFWDNSGKQIGNPRRLAEVLLALADEPMPPRKLFLGSDALKRVRDHADGMLAGMVANEPTTRSTDSERPGPV